MAVTTERLEARIGAPQKEVIRQACELEGRSMSDFVIAAAVSRAEKVIEKEQRWKLDSAQSRNFVECLLADNEPSERLKQAAKNYQNSELAH